jgi:hypothetical protein
MTQISWPVAFVLVAAVAVAGTLAGVHVISTDWIEHTLTGIIGFVLGHSLGILRVRKQSPAVTVIHPLHQPPPVTPAEPPPGGSS